MATLGSLIISLEANTAKFEAAMNKAQYQAKTTADSIKTSMVAIGTAMAGALSISSVEAAITEIAKMESGLLKMATRLNTSVETLSSFGVMIRATGMDADTFYTTLTRLEKGISTAASKAEVGTNNFDEFGQEIMKASPALNELGLNAEVLNKMPLDQKLMAIAEAMKQNIDPNDRVRIAMELAGKGAAGMVNILKDGAAGVQDYIAKQQGLGTITTEGATQAKAFTAATADLKTSWEHFKIEILSGAIPALASLIEKILQSIQASKDLKIQQDVYKANFPGVAPPEAPTGPVVKITGKWGGSWKDMGVSLVSGAPTKESGPYGEMVEPGQYNPMPYQPPAGLVQPPIKPGAGVKAGGGGGGGGKGGGGDMGLDRMQSIIDTLQKDLSRLTEGTLAEIEAWAKKTQDEIEKVGRKGADTSRAMTLVADVEAAKKKKATEDYTLFVAKESGDAYQQIEADAAGWLTKYKGFANAEQNIATIKNRKIWEEDTKQQTERLGLQNSFLNAIAGETPFLSQQLALKERMLPIETQISRLELERKLATMKLTDAQKDELRGLQAIEAQAKKYSLERAKWSTQGVAGGMQIGAEDLKKSAETWAADSTAALVKQLPQQLSSEIATSLVGFLQGKTPDLQKLGISMAESFLQKLMEGILNQIIPKMVSALADALGGALGGLGGGGGGGGSIFGDIIGGIGSIFGFHEGGLITAHEGWPPLRSDERLIKAQTGERVLSRDQNRDYEAGMAGGGRGGEIHIHNHFPNQSQVEIDRYARRLMPALQRHQARRIA